MGSGATELAKITARTASDKQIKSLLIPLT